MIKLIDLNYYMHVDISEPAEVIELQKASVGFVKFIHGELNLRLVKHMNYEGERSINGIACNFFRRRNSFFAVPFKTHYFIKKQSPDIILIQRLIFPVQIITLKILAARKVKFIVQHHGEHPYNGIKKAFQKIADRFVHKYLFTSIGNANEWIECGIISSKEKCCEVLEASTSFNQKDREKCKLQLGMIGNQNFLWVGRLHIGKDPLTVISAFEKYVTIHPEAKLYMIYQTIELLPWIKEKFAGNEKLKNSIVMQGKVFHDDLETWYNAADFYISASLKESTGYALLEAMACGCIPVVSNIPAFNKITGNGSYGFLFETRNTNELLSTMIRAQLTNADQMRSKILQHFNQHLSFESIAHQIQELATTL